MSNCLFCKILNGEIPSKKIYEDDDVFAFYDIEPKAPVHFLVVPKQHIACAGDITDENAAVVGKIFSKIAKISDELSLNKNYRVVTNSGKQAGQSVDHLHFHVLGGRDFGWPPG
jgi:histidine triad (HIT) family protein